MIIYPGVDEYGDMDEELTHLICSAADPIIDEALPPLTLLFLFGDDCDLMPFGYSWVTIGNTHTDATRIQCGLHGLQRGQAGQVIGISLGWRGITECRQVLLGCNSMKVYLDDERATPAGWGRATTSSTLYDSLRPSGQGEPQSRPRELRRCATTARGSPH